MEIKKKLRDKTGTITLNIAFIVLAIVFLLMIIIEIYRLYHITNMVKDETNSAVLAVASINVSGFYGGAREGDGQARIPSVGDFAYLVETHDVMVMMAQSMSLSQAGDTTLFQDGNYSIEGIDVQFENYENDTLHFITEMELVIDLSLAGHIFPPVTLPVEVKTRYQPKF